MKIGWMVPGFPGTGGGRIVLVICNELIKRGVDLTMFSSGGKINPQWIPTLNLIPNINDYVKTHHELGEKWDGTLVISDFGQDRILLNAFDGCQAKQRIWYLILINNEIVERLVKNDCIVLASTPWLYRQAGGYGCTNTVLLTGPSDDLNFYPYDYTRNNLCLVYPKKSGWVGAKLFRLAQVYEPSLIAGPMDLGQENWEGINYLESGIPAHDVAGLRTLYAKSNMFICTDGGASWGMNYCLIESALCMLPIVSTDWEGFGHIIENNVTALALPWNRAPLEPWNRWMVRPEPLDVAMAVVDLYRDTDLRRKLTRNAYDRAKSYNLYDWCNKFVELL